MGRPTNEEIAAREKKAGGVTFTYDTYIYHEKDAPKVLKAGESVPDEWTAEPTAELMRGWRQDTFGKWIKDK